MEAVDGRKAAVWRSGVSSSVEEVRRGCGNDEGVKLLLVEVFLEAGCATEVETWWLLKSESRLVCNRAEVSLCHRGPPASGTSAGVGLGHCWPRSTSRRSCAS